MRSPRRQAASLITTVQAAGATGAFVLRVMPMLPSRWLDRFSPAPRYERVDLPGLDCRAQGELFRPSRPGKHPAMLVCLGVIPFDVTHPQVKRLGTALARGGFVTLIYWSPEMRAFRLATDDVDRMATAYEWLLEQPFVDPSRSGMLGTCVGGAYVFLAAATARIRDRVSFLAMLAPFSSMRTLALDIASATRKNDGGREPWPVDQISRKVLVCSLTEPLLAGDSTSLRAWLLEGCPRPDANTLSKPARALLPLLDSPTYPEAEAALDQIPNLAREFDTLSPLSRVDHVRAPLIVFGHDRDDLVIPVGESRRLAAALAERPGATYTEFALFQHADPTKRKLRPWALGHQLWLFLRHIYPIFRQVAAH